MIILHSRSANSKSKLNNFRIKFRKIILHSRLANSERKRGLEVFMIIALSSVFEAFGLGRLREVHNLQ